MNKNPKPGEFMNKEKGTVLEPMREVLRDVIEAFKERVQYAPGSLLDVTVKKWERALAAQQRAETPPERRQVAFDGSPEDTILRLRANLRSVTDAYEDLIEAATFPPKGRSADDKESRDNWWEDASIRIKAARQILEDSLC